MGCREKSSLGELSSLGDDESTRKRAQQVDIREVYRVAEDLLLRRFQSRQQADRHKMKNTVEKFKMLLRLIAASMADENTTEFTEEDVLPLLSEYNIVPQVWKDLSEAIREGRVPLLQTRTDCEGRVRFLFAYRSFQQFLSSGLSGERRPSLSMLSVHPLGLGPLQGPL